MSGDSGAIRQVFSFQFSVCGPLDTAHDFTYFDCLTALASM